MCLTSTWTYECAVRAQQLFEPFGIEYSVCVNMQHAWVTKVSTPCLHVVRREFILIAIAEDMSVQVFTCPEYLRDVKPAGFISHVHD